VSSADAHVLLLTAAMKLFTQSTTLKLALASVLKTHKILAVMATILIMFHVNASVHPMNVLSMNTGTQEPVVASQNTAHVQLVIILTSIH
jgi:hypothetical protein